MERQPVQCRLCGGVASHGLTTLTHVIDFEPTAALVLGYAAGVAGIGDEKDHLYTLMNWRFAYSINGMEWGEAFPGLMPESRVRHSAMVTLLKDAGDGSSTALDSIIDFVQTEGYAAAFNPAGGFALVEWSVATVPEPAALPILAVGGLALGLAARRRVV
jgi:hypothetical protein